MIDRRSFLGAFALPLFCGENKTLFNGVSNQGWRAVAGSDFPSNCWTVSDGCLKSLVAKPAFQDIRTVEEFADFDLEFEWKISPGGNSGVKYLIYKEDRWRPAGSTEFHARGRGFEFQISDDGAEPDALAHPESRCGALYGLIPPARNASKPVGEFNTAHITRRGPAVEHWINGVRVVSAQLDNPDLGERMRVRKIPLEFPKRSPIVLQNHGSEAWFRNLRIRPY